jgi:hypothetical protein
VNTQTIVVTLLNRNFFLVALHETEIETAWRSRNGYTAIHLYDFLESTDGLFLAERIQRYED